MSASTAVACTWASISPGRRLRPPSRITRAPSRAAAAAAGPSITSAIRPSSTTTEPAKGGDPVALTTLASLNTIRPLTGHSVRSSPLACHWSRLPPAEQLVDADCQQDERAVDDVLVDRVPAEQHEPVGDQLEDQRA